MCPIVFNENFGCAKREKSTLNPSSFCCLLDKALLVHETDENVTVELSTDIFTVF